VALRAALAAGLPSWPAVLDALATAGVALVTDRVGVSFGPVTVVADGRAASHDERAAAAVAAKAQVDLAVDLGIGPAAATVTTTDLPPAALGRHGE
jgi:N-acetylglutamate synthase/N-acetylornithine aminotransferase